MLEQVIVIIHVLAAISVVALILLQQGKGADMGASFGSGASQTVLGVQGGGNFLTHSTAILVTVFFLTSLSLAYYAKEKSMVDVDDIVIEQTLDANDEVPVEKAPAAAVAPEAAPAEAAISPAVENAAAPEVPEATAVETPATEIPE